MSKFLKILVVDDEPMLRGMIRDFLESENFEVVEASNGYEAFEIIENGSFDLVISDIRMPNGDGIELAKKINLICGLRPQVVLMTGYSDITASEAREFGVIKLFSKPFFPDELVDFVKGLISVKEISIQDKDL